MIGQTIAHYKITTKLGQGGMGEVYRATDTKLGREVAIKVLPESFARDPERLARFQREANVLASLNHPAVAGIHGLERVGEVQALILELVEGETLAERLQRGPLPLDEGLDICKQIAEALEAAHEKRIVHRDLKPANVKITPEGKVKVLDFGLAKAMDDEHAMRSVSPALADSPTILESVGSTLPGVILGTAAYMSPEQAKGNSVDKQSDIWSFGCLLFECLTGHRPFAGDSAAEVIGAVIHQEPDWTNLPAGTPPAVQSLMRRCLEKKATRRLRDVGDARIELEEILAHLRSGSTISRSPATAVMAGKLKPHRLHLLIDGILVLAIVILLTLLVWKRPSQRVGASTGTGATRSIAVMYFEDKNPSEEDSAFAESLAERLTLTLSGTPGLNVLSRQKLRNSLKQLPDPTATRVSSDNYSEVAASLGVEVMVVGRIDRLAGEIRVTTQLEDTKGNLLRSQEAKGRTEADFVTIAQTLQGQIVQHLGLTQAAVVDHTGKYTESLPAAQSFQIGEILLHQVRFGEAVRQYQRAIEADPDFALAHYRLSLAAGWNGDEELALAAAAQTAALLERFEPGMRKIVIGYLLYVKGFLRQALPLLESALKENLDSTETLYLLGEIYSHCEQFGDPRKAVEVLERLLALDPAFHLVYDHLAIAYQRTGARTQLDTQRPIWRKLAPEASRIAESEIACLEGRLEEGWRLMEQSEAALYRNFSLHGLLLTSQWRLAQERIAQEFTAFDQMPQALRLNLLGYKAKYHFLNGEFEQALHTYHRYFLLQGTQRDEGWKGVWTVMYSQLVADLYLLKHDLHQAREWSLKHLRIQPRSMAALYLAGRFAVRTENPAMAEEHLQTMTLSLAEAKTDWLQFYRDALRAELFLESGQPQEAIRLLEPVIASGRTMTLLQPSYGGFLRESLAEAHLAIGDKQKAKEALHGLVHSGLERFATPGLYVLSLFRLSKLELELGETEAAREHLAMFLDHWGTADWELKEVREAKALLESLPTKARFEQ